MTRTDDDSWDITEGVGATALGVAWARAQEANSGCPLFKDTYAQRFIDAATARGWQLPPSHMVERIRAISNYAASRTKWFDNFFTTAGANGVVQAVILAAGLDARAWRLPWAHDSVVYEIDQPKVLAFKAQTLTDDSPAARYIAVPIDLRQDWPKALCDAGFDTQEPTAWAAEGLLPYLPAEGQDLLFDRIHALSAPGSRIGVESFGNKFFDPEYLANRRAQLRQMREAAGDDATDAVDVQDLWYIEDRTDVADWLMRHGWRVSTEDAQTLMERFGRPPTAATEDTTPRTTFVEGVRS
ncbi:methyltransferase, putative, TIGR00027 family [Mycolicibacterium rhodesiae NBB3]|uniref:S-adenosyl-L-methionine-dependent methyltransferase n=1 Tax=Mycolicibacterium rhodesiae (strain NBB3) TaxID=710685 RepID=G8RX00_MYCRN|nr:SAM-dependent methyltransferase [Mycolicibacterium rhodesiae]AEV71857.1 methyltransferase, putative, TIGR00027 family [Mycolicibacterium rhodesiae NBB3]